MSIRLRGVELPPHSSEFPVVIAAVSGSGIVVVGEQRVPIDPAHPVSPKQMLLAVRAGRLVDDDDSVRRTVENILTDRARA